MDKPIVKEWIVVEGKDDIAAVKRAVQAQVLDTSGLGIRASTLAIMEKAVPEPGVIILTDPDFPGEKIRRILNARVPGCKNAYLAKADSLKGDNVGVENASPQVIRQALENAKAEEAVEASYQVEDLLHLGLLSGPGARERRRQVGEALGIGYANAKQFISRIRAYGITQEQLLRAIEKVDGPTEAIEER